MSTSSVSFHYVGQIGARALCDANDIVHLLEKTALIWPHNPQVQEVLRDIARQIDEGAVAILKQADDEKKRLGL